MASATARAVMRLRPVGLGGSRSARIGAIRAHRSSGTRHIVGHGSRARVLLVHQPPLHSRPCQAMIVTLVESKRVPSCTSLITTVWLAKPRPRQALRLLAAWRPHAAHDPAYENACFGQLLASCKKALCLVLFATVYEVDLRWMLFARSRLCRRWTYRQHS